MTSAVQCPACGFASCRTSVTKTGGYSLSCPECGFQGWAKSPKAAGGIAAKLSGESAKPAPSAAPAAPAKKSSGLLIDD